MAVENSSGEPFRPFTEESLAGAPARISKENERRKELEKKRSEWKGWHGDDFEGKGLQPARDLEQGKTLPNRLAAGFNGKMVGTFLEDVDPFYQNEKTFMIVSKTKEIFRFSSGSALGFLSPFGLIRRAALATMTNRFFNYFMMATILIHFYVLLMPASPVTEFTMAFFAAIYTLELVVKVLARGFVLEKFSYLRDPWNWLDFVLVLLLYIAMIVNLGQWASVRTTQPLRTLRLLRLRITGVKVIVGAILKSLKNLQAVAILELFVLFVFAVVGLQLYMGVLTHKCIKNFWDDGTNGGAVELEKNINVHNWNASNWQIDPDMTHQYKLCNPSQGNSCGLGYTCKPGYGPSPDYDYTSFDSFGWAFLSTIRLATQDYWEALYHQILIVAGPWHFLFFIPIIFIGSFYLINLMVVTIMLSFIQVLKETAEEESARENASKPCQSEEDPAGRSSALMAAQEGLRFVDESPATAPASPITADPGNGTGSAPTYAPVPTSDSASAPRPTHGESDGWCTRCFNLFCIWDCGYPWKNLQKGVALVVFDPLSDLFIFLVILLNVIFMALDHYGLERNLTLVRTMQRGNQVFVAIFAIEAALKLIALHPKYYFKVGWNRLDFAIVVFALLELHFEDANLPGISALRSFRLLRAFRLAEFWRTETLRIIEKTLAALGKLIFVALVLISILAIMGTSLFAKNYFDAIEKFPGEEMPRWNFTDFWHSWMIVFRALCGEWIETMWDCLLVGDVSCLAFFMVVVVVCNFIILSLYFAIVLRITYEVSILRLHPVQATRLDEAFNRIGRVLGWITSIFRTKNRASVHQTADKSEKQPMAKVALDGAGTDEKPGLGESVGITIDEENGELKSKPAAGQKGCLVIRSPAQISPETQQERRTVEFFKNKEESEETISLKSVGSDAPKSGNGLTADSPPVAVKGGLGNFRTKAFVLTQSNYFVAGVMIVILFSCIALAFEDINLSDSPALQSVLRALDMVFTVFFFVEMVVKLIGLGFKKYFTTIWCRFEFFLVVIPILDWLFVLCGFGTLALFFAIRSLRAFRVLEPLSRWKSMRILLNTLVNAIHPLLQVTVASAYIWLIFGILGVQLFNGKFYKCLQLDETRPDYRTVNFKSSCELKNYTWANSAINFDHVGKACLSLFQVATFKGWISIMNDAIDSRQLDEQPHREVNFVMYSYFVLFIVFGAFLTRSLIISALIDNFTTVKKVEESEETSAENEQNQIYTNILKKAKERKPTKVIPAPTWKPQVMIYKLVMSHKFDAVFTTIILLNVIVMSTDHYTQAQIWEDTLMILNAIFIATFVAEAVIKIIALRCHYFTVPWNVYDFIVALLSVLGIILSDLVSQYLVSPTLLRIVRLARIGSVLRLFPSSRPIRKLLRILCLAFPSLFAICVLLFLVMFVYAIFGMTFFKHVQLKGGLDAVFNFQTFPESMLLLFPIFTGAGWDGILAGIISEDKDCEGPDPEFGKPGNCGNPRIGIKYMVSYVIICYYIIVNLIIAVIFAFTSEAIEEELTDDDFDSYFATWEEFDPNKTQYIRYDQLTDFLDKLEPPLRVCKPNKFKIIAMVIPICKDDMVSCDDILESLIRNFLASKGTHIDETTVEPLDDRSAQEPVSSTLWRNREEYSARLIQNNWKRYKGKDPALAPVPELADAKPE